MKTKEGHPSMPIKYEKSEEGHLWGEMEGSKIFVLLAPGQVAQSFWRAVRQSRQCQNFSHRHRREHGPNVHCSRVGSRDWEPAWGTGEGCDMSRMQQGLAADYHVVVCPRGKVDTML